MVAQFVNIPESTELHTLNAPNYTLWELYLNQGVIKILKPQGPSWVVAQDRGSAAGRGMGQVNGRTAECGTVQTISPLRNHSHQAEKPGCLLGEVLNSFSEVVRSGLRCHFSPSFPCSGCP